MVDIRDKQAEALRDVATADAGVQAAKRNHSVAAGATAELKLHAAVDAARELGVEWGRIGSALGIARGCAYQRYRRKPCASRADSAA